MIHLLVFLSPLGVMGALLSPTFILILGLNGTLIPAAHGRTTSCDCGCRNRP